MTKRCALLLGRLSPNEWRRRIWHFSPGVVALVVTPFPHVEPLSPLVRSVIVMVAVLLPVAAICTQTTFRRQYETNCLSAVLGYAATIIPLLLLFPWQPELGFTVMGVIAFGDGSATLAGLLAGNGRLPWNAAKSWTGTAAFVAVGIPAATMIYWHEAMPRVGIETALACIIPTVLASAAVESLPFKCNDNFLVGATAATVLLATHMLFVGF